MNEKVKNVLVLFAILGLLYLFLVSIGMVGASFKLLGKGAANQVFGFAANPVAGLFIGILSTSLVQSSSTTTSIVVGLVAGGMPVSTAIPMIMGANIGTSVTNTLVSIGHIGRKEEFKRAFAASTVHDFFNLMAVLVLFPLQYATDFLGVLSSWLAGLLTGGADMDFHSPIELACKPVINLVVDLLAVALPNKTAEAVVLLVLAGILLFVALKYISKLLQGVVLQKAKKLFQETLFRTAPLAFVVGIVLTIMVQSSSVTTSLVVPLAGAGVLTLAQIYPYTLGANVGTTVTALLAALAVSDHFEAAVTVALSHLFFNIVGIGMLTPLPFTRRIPMWLAQGIADQAVERRWVPVLYIVVVFFIIPLSLLYATG